MLDQIVLLATYNSWMNRQLYSAASRLPQVALTLDRKAFFGSIIGTLNHIMAGDINWLKRFAAHPAQPPALAVMRSWPAPAALDAVLYEDLTELCGQRRQLDCIIETWAAGLTASDLSQVLRYTNTRGEVAERDFGSLVLHFFNHQTHHRGQASTLLSQAGVDIGPTDLVLMIPDRLDGQGPP